MSRFLSIAFVSTFGIAALWPEAALACAACSGKSNDHMVAGLNAGIFTLLVILLLVLSMIGSMVVRFIRLQSRMVISQGTAMRVHVVQSQFSGQPRWQTVGVEMKEQLHV